MTQNKALIQRLQEATEGICLALSSAQVKEACRSLKANPELWKQCGDGEIHRVEPYPMGFNPAFGRPDHMNRIYWSRGWGMSESLAFWERHVLRIAALSAKEDSPDHLSNQEQGNG